ncbi:MAG: zinc ABC transporter solute-binding protein, partial [Actinobacteria bacterium]|nr:zinc ABC transporter substrate-binding protein [Actinomycetota bacterium]NIS32999.1 zinc ABC transporter substrate-binding protein [Actinomycetota bacterium]NIU67934.1 zinc ABC transporter substrate-binding protein [Actinomycetota bacterium]NIW29724.1 zinc ABC transporter solute-binding protein [Actinomycetota bacterium]NIX22222.1 zinc ABC transporter solute-binding protein [Actinomycetota bacterium]
HDHDDQDLDPHVWLDPIRMELAVGEVADALADRFPDRAWDEPAEEITTGLRAADALIREILSVVPEERRQLVTSHDV